LRLAQHLHDLNSATSLTSATQWVELVIPGLGLVWMSLLVFTMVELTVPLITL